MSIFSYLHTICSVRHVLVEQVAVVLHVVGEEVGGGAHHQAVPVHGVVEAAGGEAEDLLVDVQEAEVHVGLSAHHPSGHVAHPLVWIVDKHLEYDNVKQDKVFFALSVLRSKGDLKQT